MLIEHHPSRLN
jgi:hypothetical protein